MSRPRPVSIDFVAPPRQSLALGLGLCVAGALAAGLVALAFQQTLSERARLEAELDGFKAAHRAAPVAPTNAADELEAAKAAREMAVPWSKLLAELEGASHDLRAKVSLLQIEPNADKHVVRITAEVHELSDALLYLQRLEASPVLRYPVLESHELRKDDPQRPLRIKVIAEWRS